MDWIPALLKHLAVARSAVVATFVTAAVLLLGPSVAPTFAPHVPSKWEPVLIAVLVFCACLLVIWGIEAVFRLAKKLFAAAKAYSGGKAKLSHMESSVLYAMGCSPTEPLNLDRVDYSGASSTRLEFMEVVRGLSEKGLVETNPFGRELVSLTDAGRKRALEIHRIEAAKK